MDQVRYPAQNVSGAASKKIGQLQNVFGHYQTHLATKQKKKKLAVLLYCLHLGPLPQLTSSHENHLMIF
jgi:hypothetical protein